MVARRMLWVSVGVFAVLFTNAGSGQDRPKKDEVVNAELKRLAGDWQIVAAEKGGQKVESNDIVEFSGSKCTIINPATKLVFDNSFEIDRAKSPKWMDVTNLRTKRSWTGIYELKGDTLRAVFQGDKDGKRPTEFKTKEGSLEVMYTYKRLNQK